MAAIPVVAQVQKPKDTLVILTPSEETWLRNHKPIRVGMSPTFPPLKFSEKGVIKGIEPDYLNLLSEYTGIQFEYVVCDFSVMDAKIKSGEMDMFLSFNIPQRLSYMTFTKPFMEFKQVIIARNDAPFMSGIAALKGKKMATVKGVRLYDKLLSPYPEIEAVPVGTMEEMFRAVSESKADALIAQTFLAGYMMPNYPNLKAVGVPDLPPEPYLYAVRKDYPELVGILNKAIQSIPKDRFDAIVQKWFTIRVEYRPNWSEITKWAVVIVGVFTLILGLTLFWNRRLVWEIDIRKKTEVTLRESELLRRLSIDNMLEAYALHEAIFNESGRMVDYRFLDFNPAAQKIANMAREEIVGRTAMELYPHIVERGLLDRYADVMTTGVSAIIEDFYYAGDNLDKAFDISCFRIDDRHFVCVFRDITARKKAEETLRESEKKYRELSIIDDLTKLYNSRHFYHQLKMEIDRVDRYEQPLTLLLLDLDDFKRFNDAYGHIEGDQVLLRLGQVVKRCLRQTDSAYRYGGEEFTILLPMTASVDGAVTAERIRKEFRQETFSPTLGQDVHVTVSIGLAQYKLKEDMRIFVHRVDQLMYQGKRNGKDRVCAEP
jgi:diguanylate cyclase (GGDEF)-like protein/PAS domain S-box-containing protein